MVWFLEVLTGTTPAGGSKELPLCRCSSDYSSLEPNPRDAIQPRRESKRHHALRAGGRKSFLFIRQSSTTATTASVRYQTGLMHLQTGHEASSFGLYRRRHEGFQSQLGQVCLEWRLRPLHLSRDPGFQSRTDTEYAVRRAVNPLVALSSAFSCPPAQLVWVRNRVGQPLDQDGRDARATETGNLLTR